jgi:hypothetical protein
VRLYSRPGKDLTRRFPLDVAKRVGLAKPGKNVATSLNRGFRLSAAARG